MQLKELLEEKINTGVGIEFTSLVLKNGNKVMGFKDAEGNTYVIAASLDNFNRFRKWDKIKAVADFLKVGKVRLDNGDKVPTVRLRVDIETEGPVHKDNKEPVF